MSIRDTLIQEARRITDHALADMSDEAVWRKLLPEKRRQFMEMMGLEKLASATQRTRVKANVTGTIQRPAYRIEKLSIETLPELYVTANLYLPNSGAPGGKSERLPAVLYLCGHGTHQKAYYQAHPRRFAELGFVCLIMETIQLGEGHGYHHGTYREGWWHWISRGYSPAGVELYNGIRALDYLSQRAEVDKERFGVTGISGGGASTWYLAAGDERVQVAAPVCGTATLDSHVRDRTIDGHCDCMWWPNTYQWDLADIGALIAPRPLMIASADRDEIFTIASIRKVHSQVKQLYTKLGAQQNLHLVETPGGHSYHAQSRTAIFSLFLKHLQGKSISSDTVGDIDESPQQQEKEGTLRAYANGTPKSDLTATIQDSFIELAKPTQIADVPTLDKSRSGVIDALKAKTFRAFPNATPALDTKVEFEFQSGDNAGFRFAFTSEKDWRLHGDFRLRADIAHPAPAILALRSPEEERWATEGFLGNIRAPWAKVIVETRGIGDTAWGQGLQWHLRRASAWTGQTIASMRVWDTLRALEALRAIPAVKGQPISLAARGEMAAVALYAALLDGNIHTLFLQSPPATQNAPSRPDGRGEAIEMLNCLRITDLPQVAGLLFPTEIIVTGDYPDTYNWARDLYRTLGKPDLFRHIPDLSQWKPV